VVPAEELLDASLRMARLMAANNAFGVWQTKIGLNAALDAPSLRHAKEIENRTQILTGFTHNPEEAARAHREKRDPVWDAL
jgi:enoyl-CoA hydratase/carnithine racemase